MQVKLPFERTFYMIHHQCMMAESNILDHSPNRLCKMVETPFDFDKWKIQL